ncbi:MAG: hypothetical protein SFT92_04235 [Rickettsiales bacterium]|nr:hypothetical protein [Rickettsiales bacterium]
MLAPDVIGLRQFYGTFLGMQVQSLVGSAVRRFWPAVGQDELLAIGFCAPYLEPYSNDSKGLYICMPAQQGASYWPSSDNNRVFLSHEAELPLANDSVNRVLLIHSVETSEQLSWMMREVWRVLTPEGRVLAVVPNRRSLWSHSVRSPFGYGRPFNMAQLKTLMTDYQFTPTRTGSALFMPPLHIESAWRAAVGMEWLGRLFCPFFGGVWLVEAEKQLYATIHQSAISRQPIRRSVIATPAMSRK